MPMSTSSATSTRRSSGPSPAAPRCCSWALRGRASRARRSRPSGRRMARRGSSPRATRTACAGCSTWIRGLRSGRRTLRCSGSTASAGTSRRSTTACSTAWPRPACRSWPPRARRRGGGCSPPRARTARRRRRSPRGRGRSSCRSCRAGAETSRAERLLEGHDVSKGIGPALSSKGTEPDAPNAADADPEAEPAPERRESRLRGIDPVVAGARRRLPPVLRLGRLLHRRRIVQEGGDAVDRRPGGVRQGGRRAGRPSRDRTGERRPPRLRQGLLLLRLRR